ncbi:MAG: hypothetical protein MPN21_16110 [Thermoanaerobaculia bacterium]|nr:hypothetical protein [Thermoanaerobaculia bacterium]
MAAGRTTSQMCLALAMIGSIVMSGGAAKAQIAGYDRATVTTLRWDPSTPDRVYAGTVGWGLVVSEDGGRTWSATAPQLGGRAIQSIAVHPLLANLVFVGTLRQGVWMSADAGRTFQRVLHELPEVDVPAVSLAVREQPTDGKETGEAVNSVVWVALRHRGPVRSDGEVPVLGERSGETARRQPFHDLTAHPTRPDDVLVAGRDGVARTRDGGATWTRVLNPFEFQESPHFLRTHDAATCREVPFRFWRRLADPDSIWLSACYGLFHSGDGGASWKMAPLGGFGRVHQVSADPTDPNLLAVSTDLGVLRSSDGGTNWEYLRAAAPDAPFRGLIVMPGGEVLAGGFGGEMVRADRDGHVEVGRLRELQATQRDPVKEAARRSTAPYDRAGLAARPEANPRLRPGIDLHVADLAVHPNLSNVVFAGTRRGVFRSEDHGVTWRGSSQGLGEMEISALLADRSGALVDPGEADPAGERVMLWAATRGAGIYRSLSSGRAWQSVDMPEDGVVRVLLQDRRGPHTLWAGTADDGVYRSRDAGASWQPVSQGLGEHGIRALVQSGGALLAATDNGELYDSYDEGDSWRRRGDLSRRVTEESEDLRFFESLGLDPRAMHFHDLLADPGASEALIAASGFGVFRSHDGGHSWRWSDLRRGVARLLRDPYDADRVFAATTRGLWWSEDRGKSWRQADFGRALSELALRGGDLDATRAIRETPPLFALAVSEDGDILAGTDRGQVVRGSVRRGGWSTSHLARPPRIRPLVGTGAPRQERDREPSEEEQRLYDELRTRRDQLLVAAALAGDDVRRWTGPRRRILQALEARRRGEVPAYPLAVLEQASPNLREELEKEDPATRVLRLADGDIRSLKTEFVDGWGVDDVFFGPLGRLLAVQTSVDDGRETHTELRIYDLQRRFLQSENTFRRQGSTSYWKVLHDLARKPSAAQPDWLLEDTGPVLLWRRAEFLVTRPRDDRIAIWRLTPRGSRPAPASPVRPGTVHGFPLPVKTVSISEDGRWLGAIDVAGQAFFVPFAGHREPVQIEIPTPEGAEPPAFQQVHATSKQLLLLGPSGIVAYRWGREGPRVRSPEGEDAGDWLFGAGAGFSKVVGDRQGRWMAALPATSSKSTETVVVVAFREGLATAVFPLDAGTEERWTATVSAQQRWLAIRRSSRSSSESLLYEMADDLTEAGPQLAFRVRDASDLRFGAGGGHVAFAADGESQIWDLQGPAPRRLETEPLDLRALEDEFEEADPFDLAAFFLEGDPRWASRGEWAPYGRERSYTRTSSDGRWLAVAGPGRQVRLWHFDDEKGLLAPATGTLLLDLSRFRAYPSSRPSALDAWPEIREWKRRPAAEELWQQACSTAGRNLDRDEWRYLFGEEDWAPSCVFE